MVHFRRLIDLFCQGILPCSEIQAVAVAARDLDRAQTFAQRYGISKAYGSYQELADDPNVGKL